MPDKTPTPVIFNNPHGSSVASLAAGIVSIIISIVPFLGFIFGVTAVIFGIIGLKSKKNPRWAKAGIVTGSVGIVISIIVSTLFIIAVLTLEIPDQA